MKPSWRWKDIVRVNHSPVHNGHLEIIREYGNADTPKLSIGSNVHVMGGSATLYFQ